MSHCLSSGSKPNYDILVLTSEVKQFIKDNINVQMSMDANASHTKRGLQHLVSIKPRDRELRSIYELILSHAVKAEMACSGAGLMFMELVSDCPRQEKHRKNINTISDIRNAFKNLNLKKDVLSVMNYVLDIADVNSNISLKKTVGQQMYVELTQGYNFNANSLLQISTIHLEEAVVACIDGYVETVAEVHHLFSDMSEKKVPCILFVRGMADDVLHTIKVNNDRKTMLVFPYSLPFDVDNVNSIVDIAIATGTDVVSSTKGNLISSLEYSMLGTAQNCLLSSSHVRVNNRKHRVRVSLHLSDLKKRSTERTEIAEILSKRIKSLSSSCIEIGIPNDINFYSTQQQFDEAIRAMSAILNDKYKPWEYASLFFESFKEMNKLHLLI